MRGYASSLETVSPPRFYLIFAAVSGLFFALLMPPFLFADEFNHYSRILQLSQGQLFGEKRGDDQLGGILPYDLFLFHNQFSDVPNNPARKTSLEEIQASLETYPSLTESSPKDFIHFGAPAMYFPSPYLPQILAVKLGQLFGANIVHCLYLARLFTLIAFLTLITLTLVILPESLKTVFLMLSTLPMTNYLGASISADAMTTGYSFLLLGLACKALKERGLAGKWIAIAALLSFLLVLSKSVYFLIPTVFTYAFLSTKYSKAKSLIGAAIVCLASVVLTALWASQTQHLFVNLRQDAIVDPKAQMHIVLTQPWFFLRAIAYSIWDFPYNYLEFFVGIFGWNEIRLPMTYVIGTVIFLALLILKSASSQRKWLRETYLQYLAGLSFTAIFLLVFLGAYLTWTAVGNPRCDAPAGRYFLPIIPLSLFFAPNWLPKIDLRYYQGIAMGLACIGALLTMLGILNRYYF